MKGGVYRMLTEYESEDPPQGGRYGVERSEDPRAQQGTAGGGRQYGAVAARHGDGSHSVEVPYPGHRPEHGRHIETGTRTRWKTGPGNQGNQPGKGTGSIRRKKSDTYSVPDGTEYIKRKKEYDCNID